MSEDKLKLDLDSLLYEYQLCSTYDESGLKRFIIIKKKDKQACIDELVNDFRGTLESSFEEVVDDDDYDDDY